MALCYRWFDFLVGKYGREADFDDFCFAANLCDDWPRDGFSEYGDGWFDGLDHARNYDDILGCGAELSLDIVDKLSCQLRLV